MAFLWLHAPPNKGRRGAAAAGARQERQRAGGVPSAGMVALVVLVGIPGSGKSTLAQQLCTDPSRWEWISQDTLGSRQACEKALHDALLAGKSAVVDRCNFDARQRDIWLRVARNAVGHMQAVAVQLLLPLELCIQRVASRTGHPTLGRHNAGEVCRRFYGDFQVVQRCERFSQVLTAHSEQDVVHVMRQLLQLLSPSMDEHVTSSTKRWKSHDEVVTGTRHMLPQSHPAASFPIGQAPLLLAPAAGFQQGGGSLVGPSMPQMTWQQVHWQQQQQQHPQQHPQHAPYHASTSDGNFGPSPHGADPHMQAAYGCGRGGRVDGGGHRRNGRGRGVADHELSELATRFADPRSKVRYDEQTSAPTVPAAERAGDAGQVTWADTLGAASEQAACLTQQQAGAAGQEEAAAALQPRSADPLMSMLRTGNGGDHKNRIILLFDLNGTLTSHTSKRHSSGVNKLRPQLTQLVRLHPHFRLGIFTSATLRTVALVHKMLEGTAGLADGLFEPNLVLYRDHTVPAPKGHVDSTGGVAKQWDTVKPLNKYFSHMHRVILFDDDAHKASPGEERNMVRVPVWDDTDDSCTLLAALVDAVLEVLGPLDEHADVRDHTPAITDRLSKHQQQHESRPPIIDEHG